MNKFIDFIWPYLRQLSASDLAARTAEDTEDVKKIRGTDWSQDHELALQEAKFLADLENERKKGAENRASIYLGATAAIVPVSLPICTAFYADEFFERSAPFQFISVLFFLLSTAYLIGGAWWAFRTFKVVVHHRVDATDYSDVWAKPDRKSGLVAELLVASRLNRHMVNWKTTCVRLAHEFIIRAVLAFTALAILVVCWEPAATIVKWSKSKILTIISIC